MFTPTVRKVRKVRNLVFAMVAAAMLCASPSFLGGASALARPVVVRGHQTAAIVRVDPATALGAGGLDAGCSVSAFVQAEIGYDPCSQDRAATMSADPATVSADRG
jgi:hypothetical protein